MDPQQIAIDALKAAIAATPQNTELSVQLSELFSNLGREDEAEQTVRDALRSSPESADLQLQLATLFYRSGRGSHASAIVETLVGDPLIGARALVLQARLLLNNGDRTAAVEAYKNALTEDESLSDPSLESLLGWDSDDADEVLATPLTSDGESLDSDSFEFGPEADGDPKVEEGPSLERGLAEGFEAVGGMDGVKEQIRLKILYPLEHADMYAAYGKKIGGGILLYGPPGCGKTHLARATAGEVQAGFLSVGISDVLDMWMGNSEKNLHELFEKGRRHKPSVLFFDEVDALGASRSDMRRSAGRHLINQFLSELDGVDADNDGLLILAATNTPWHLDSAFRRPGRFDRVIFVPPPDATGRAAITKIQLKGKPSEEINFKKVAAATDGFSGADLQAMVDTCVEAKLSEAIQSGLPKPITTSDLVKAAKALRPTTKEWFNTAKNHALYANDGGLYDEVLDYLKVRR
ncbi:MAG: AAA family ATPase [Planctomycetota bacterium]